MDMKAPLQSWAGGLRLTADLVDQFVMITRMRLAWQLVWRVGTFCPQSVSDDGRQRSAEEACPLPFKGSAVSQLFLTASVYCARGAA